MSVYTQLTDDQFAAFCHSFGVQFARAIPITQGIKTLTGLFKRLTMRKASTLMYLLYLKSVRLLISKNGGDFKSVEW